MALNFTFTKLDSPCLEAFGISERRSKGGPLDNERYGPAVSSYVRTPEPVELRGSGTDARNVGVRIERY